MSWRLLNIIIFLLGTVTIYSQWRDHYFDVKGSRDGLNTNINGIAQDSLGYIYLATGQGVMRYDGAEFKHFLNNFNDSTTVGAGEAWNIITDKEGNIWIGLRFNGLNKYSPKTGKFSRYEFPHESIKNVPSVTSIFDDNRGSLWIGSLGFRLFKFDKKTETFETYIPDWYETIDTTKRLSIHGILQDKDNPDKLWFSLLDYSPIKGNYMGLVSFDKNTGKFKSEACGSKIFFQDEEGILWGGRGGSGIWKYDPSNSNCTNILIEVQDNGKAAYPLIRHILPAGNFKWMVKANSISKLYADESYDILLYDRDLGFIENIFKDHFGNFWFGGTNGLHIINKKRQHINFYPLDKLGINDRIYPGALAYSKKDQSIYLANNTTELLKVPLQKDQNGEIITSEDRILGITEDGNGEIIISSGKGLEKINPIGFKTYSDAINIKAFKLLADEATIAGISRSKFFWINKSSGNINKLDISDFNESTQGFIGFHLRPNAKALIFSDQLYEIDLESSAIKHFKYENKLNPNQLELRSVIQDQSGDYWVVFPNQLCQFEVESDSLTLKNVYSSNNGLENNWVQRLFEDYKGRIWVYSGNGLNCIDPENEEVRYFGVKDGLPVFLNDPWKIIEIDQNRIASVSGNGIIAFHPDSLWNSKSEEYIPVIIKNIRIDGKAISSELSPHFLDKIIVEPGQNVVDFEFQGLSFPEDPRVEYAYRIEELNEDWIDIGTNKFVTLPSLSPGNYTFELRAGKLKNPARQKKIEIQVLAPFYKKPWFLLTSGLILAGLLFFLLRYRMKILRQKEEKKTAQAKKEAELELKALRSQMNPHFMFNSLNSIKNYILQAKPKIAAEYLSNFAHLIRMILQNSRERSISLQEELDTLLLYIDLEKLRFDNEFDFQCHIAEGVDLETVLIPPMILQPYIENAIWHGLMRKKTKGNLTLSIKKIKSTGIQCIIDDDGVGRKATQQAKNNFNKKYKSMGMGITKDRIDIINKMDSLRITVDVIDKFSEEDEALGTKVIITIPMI